MWDARGAISVAWKAQIGKLPIGKRQTGTFVWRTGTELAVWWWGGQKKEIVTPHFAFVVDRDSGLVDNGKW